MPLPFRLVGMILERADGSAIIFDATLESTHERVAEITSSPVESGAEIVDHRRRRPVSYRFTSLVMNDAPTNQVAQQRKINGVGNNPDNLPTNIALDPTRAVDLYEEVLELHDTNAVFTLYTDFEVIENTMIEGLDAAAVGQGDGIEIVGVIRDVQFATTDVVTVPQQAQRTSKKKKKKGTKSGAAQPLSKLRSKDAFLFIAEDVF